MSNKNQFSKDRFTKPEIFLAELLRKSAQGSFHERDENVPFLHRASVVAVDVVGGKLENPKGDGKITHKFNGKSIDIPATIGPENPRNSIKARILTGGFDQFFNDDDLRVFWPFFSEHDTSPIKPGEHVYVVFEDSDFQHGLWINRIPGHEGNNFIRGESTFKSDSDDKLASKFPDSAGASSDDSDAFNTDKAAGESRVNNGYLTKLFGG